MNDVSRILSAIDQGDPHAAEQLLPLVYAELRQLAARKMAQENPGQTLEATALVHEVFLRLVIRPSGEAAPQSWNSRGHFFAAAAQAMRRILVERARHRQSVKAGGGRDRVELGAAEVDVAIALSRPADDLLDLDAALDRLAQAHPRKAALVKLRYFAGLSNEDAARALNISASTADNDWAYARSWLRVDLSRQRADGH